MGMLPAILALVAGTSSAPKIVLHKPSLLSLCHCTKRSVGNALMDQPLIACNTLSAGELKRTTSIPSMGHQHRRASSYSCSRHEIGAFLDTHLQFIEMLESFWQSAAANGWLEHQSY